MSGQVETEPSRSCLSDQWAAEDEICVTCIVCYSVGGAIVRTMCCLRLQHVA